MTKEQAKQIIKDWEKIRSIKAKINSVFEICDTEPTLQFYRFEDFENFCKVFGLKYEEIRTEHYVVFYKKIRIACIK